MNLRRVIHFSASALVSLLAMTSVGIVLWVADEGFGWDLFPDWLENCASVLLVSIGLLTAFSVIACLTASAALVALSMAERFGTEPDYFPSKAKRWAMRGVFVVTVLAIATGIALQRVDNWRSARMEATRREEHKRDFETTRAALAKDVVSFAGKFDYRLAAAAATGEEECAKDIHDLLRSFSASSQLSPSVWLVVRSNPPYAWCRLAANPKGRENNGFWLVRSPLVDLPSVWERDTVAALFNGAELSVPHGRSGAVIDTREPCAWAPIKAQDETVVALLVFQSEVRHGWSR